VFGFGTLPFANEPERLNITPPGTPKRSSFALRRAAMKQGWVWEKSQNDLELREMKWMI